MKSEGKIRKRIDFIVFAVAFILSFGGHISPAMAIEVCGGIYSDTTWTVAGSPYHVTCDVTLFPGYTLTIEPGVTIEFDPSTSLIIRSTLNAIGTPDNRIMFTSVSPPDNWGGVHMATNLGGKAIIEYADFYHASTTVSVECCWGSEEPAVITNCTFRYNRTALGGYAGNDVIVRYCTFENNTYAVSRADKEIYNSVFRNNDYGLYQTERINVYSSTFTGNQVALWGGRGEIKHCDINNNTTGIKAFFEGFDLSENTITNNDAGIILGEYDGHTPPVQYNNIYDNITYNIKNSGSTDKYVPNNWWGTTDLDEIATKIYDGYDDPSLGIVHFEPILTEPVIITPLPDISVTPSSYDFGNINVGSLSTAKTFTMANTGDADLVIGTIVLTGTDASEFSIQDDNCSGETIAPSGTCIVDVVFSASSEGGKSASLSIPSNDPDIPTLDLPLIGTGRPQESEGATLSFGAKTGTPDSTVSIPITLDNNSAIVGCQFDVVFNSDVLEGGGSAEPSAALEATGFGVISSVVEPGRIRIVIAPPAQTPLPIIPNGEVVALPIHIKADAPECTEPLDFENVSSSDRDGNPVSIGTVPAEITISNIQLSLGAETGTPDSTVSIPITLDNNSAIVGCQFDVVFNSDVLEGGGSAEPSAALEATGFSVISSVVEPGRVRLVITPLVQTPLPIIPNGKIVILPIHIKLNVPEGTEPLNFENVFSSDRDGNPVSIGTVPGEITITYIQPGDANGDEQINVQDVIGIINVILGTGTASGSPDCNNDGSVNVQDVICVINKILGG